MTNQTHHLKLPIVSFLCLSSIALATADVFDGKKQNKAKFLSLDHEKTKRSQFVPILDKIQSICEHYGFEFVQPVPTEGGNKAKVETTNMKIQNKANLNIFLISKCFLVYFVCFVVQKTKRSQLMVQDYYYPLLNSHFFMDFKSIQL